MDRRVYQSKGAVVASMLYQMGNKAVNVPAYFKKHKALQSGRFIYSNNKKYIEKLSRGLPFVYYILAYSYGGKPYIHIKTFSKHEYDITLDQLLKIGQSKKPVKLRIKSYSYMGANTKATIYCCTDRNQLEKMKAKIPNKVIKKPVRTYKAINMVPVQTLDEVISNMKQKVEAQKLEPRIFG